MKNPTSQQVLRNKWCFPKNAKTKMTAMPRSIDLKAPRTIYYWKINAVWWFVRKIGTNNMNRIVFWKIIKTTIFLFFLYRSLGVLAVWTIFLLYYYDFLGLFNLLNCWFVFKRFAKQKLWYSIYYVTEVPIDLNWMYLVGLNVCVFITCLLAMMLPSLLVTRIKPIKVLRFDWQRFAWLKV